MPTPLLALSQLCFALPNQGPALFANLSFALYPGERVAIVGGEASGKSCLMRLMAGLMVPDSGQVLFKGSALCHPPPQPGGVALLFREAANHFLAPVAGEEIRLGMARGSDRQQSERTATLLSMVGLPPQAVGWSLSTLSASQQYRVALAALLAGKPALILADEPGHALDSEGEEGVANLFARQCQSHAVAQLILTSRLDRADRFADRILSLGQGILTPLSTTPSPNSHP
ncbi:MAG: ABC transporter ATP-binding protein [Magnetococcales bacterium]|nr:ABC transporter ATP-binding protein [Magnetococcales bacterium]